MPSSISPHFLCSNQSLKLKNTIENKNFGYKRGQISLYKVRGILSSFYKNQNTLKCEYF